MQRLFTMIIASCLLFLTVTSFMDSKKNQPIQNDTGAEITQLPPQPPIAQEQHFSPEEPQTQQPQNPQQEKLTQEKRDALKKELEELANNVDTIPPETHSENINEYAEILPSTRTQYTKEKSWEYTTTTENDLSALDNLLN